MNHPFRPRSRRFRAVLGVALLAWAMLATGALTGPSHVFNETSMDTAIQKTASHIAAHCDGMQAERGATHHTPATPMGLGDCCHGGCHCLSACNAVLTVPYLPLARNPQRTPLPMFTSASPVLVSAAPPLRPPIA